MRWNQNRLTAPWFIGETDDGPGDGCVYDLDVLTNVRFARPRGGKHYFIVTTNSDQRELLTKESEAVELDWYFSILSRGKTDEISVSELAEYIRGLNALVAKERYSMLDNILTDIVKNSVSNKVLLAFSRAAFPIRSKLSGWRRFLIEVKAELEKAGKDSESLLKGMI